MLFFKKTRGFSIIEILIVAAIIGLVGSLVITNFGTLLDAFSAKDPSVPFLEAVQEARMQAISRGESVYLRMREGACQIMNPQEEVLMSLPMPHVEAIFYGYLPQKGLSSKIAQQDSVALAVLPFGADGGSPSVQVVLSTKEDTRSFRLDSFSSCILEK